MAASATPWCADPPPGGGGTSAAEDKQSRSNPQSEAAARAARALRAPATHRIGLPMRELTDRDGPIPDPRQLAPEIGVEGRFVEAVLRPHRQRARVLASRRRETAERASCTGLRGALGRVAAPGEREHRDKNWRDRQYLGAPPRVAFPSDPPHLCRIDRMARPGFVPHQALMPTPGGRVRRRRPSLDCADEMRPDLHRVCRNKRPTLHLATPDRAVRVTMPAQPVFTPCPVTPPPRKRRAGATADARDFPIAAESRPSGAASAPLDVLVRVFEFLPRAQLADSVTHVSRSWHAAAETRALWRDEQLFDDDGTLNTRCVRARVVKTSTARGTLRGTSRADGSPLLLRFFPVPAGEAISDLPASYVRIHCLANTVRRLQLPSMPATPAPRSFNPPPPLCAAVPARPARGARRSPGRGRGPAGPGRGGRRRAAPLRHPLRRAAPRAGAQPGPAGPGSGARFVRGRDERAGRLPRPGSPARPRAPALRPPHPHARPQARRLAAGAGLPPHLLHRRLHSRSSAPCSAVRAAPALPGARGASRRPGTGAGGGVGGGVRGGGGSAGPAAGGGLERGGGSVRHFPPHGKPQRRHVALAGQVPLCHGGAGHPRPRRLSPLAPRRPQQAAARPAQPFPALARS